MPVARSSREVPHDKPHHPGEAFVRVVAPLERVGRLQRLAGLLLGHGCASPSGHRARPGPFSSLGVARVTRLHLVGVTVARRWRGPPSPTTAGPLSLCLVSGFAPRRIARWPRHVIYRGLLPEQSTLLDPAIGKSGPHRVGIRVGRRAGTSCQMCSGRMYVDAISGGVAHAGGEGVHGSPAPRERASHVSAAGAARRGSRLRRLVDARRCDTVLYSSEVRNSRGFWRIAADVCGL